MSGGAACLSAGCPGGPSTCPLAGARGLIGMTGPRGRGHCVQVDVDTAAACRELLERRGVRRGDPGSCLNRSWRAWDDLTSEPFVAAYMAPALTAAYDELIRPVEAIGGHRGGGGRLLPLEGRAGQRRVRHHARRTLGAVHAPVADGETGTVSRGHREFSRCQGRPVRGRDWCHETRCQEGCRRSAAR
jgi:hypothetical protein